MSKHFAATFILLLVQIEGAYSKAYLGCLVHPITSESPNEVITALVQNGPAIASGLELYDVIVSVDGDHKSRLSDVIANGQPGRLITLEVRRNGNLRVINAKLEENPVDGERQLYEETTVLIFSLDRKYDDDQREWSRLTQNNRWVSTNGTFEVDAIYEGIDDNGKITLHRFDPEKNVHVEPSRLNNDSQRRVSRIREVESNLSDDVFELWARKTDASFVPVRLQKDNSDGGWLPLIVFGGFIAAVLAILHLIFQDKCSTCWGTGRVSGPLEIVHSPFGDKLIAGPPAECSCCHGSGERQR